MSTLRLIIFFVFAALMDSAAQDKPSVIQKFSSNIRSFGFGVDAGVTHIDILANNTFPQNIGQYTGAHVSVNQLSLWSNINILGNSPEGFDLILFEVGLGYRFDVTKKFSIIPKIGISGGSGTFNETAFDIQNGMIGSLGFRHVLAQKNNHNLIMGVAIDYRHWRYEPVNFFPSQNMFGLTLKLGYWFSKTLTSSP